MKKITNLLLFLVCANVVVGQLQFTEKPDLGNYNMVAQQAVDIDSDGYLDVLVIIKNEDPINFNHSIGWMKNVSGVFTEVIMIDFLSNGVFTSIYGSDLDNDGDIDIVAAYYSSPNNKIVWYENNGSGIFSLPQQIYNTTQNTILNNINCSDLDNDGDIDIYFLDSPVTVVPIIRIFNNIGGGNFQYAGIFNTPNIVSRIYSFDVDMDGFNDMVLDELQTSSFPKYQGVSWRKNLGSFNFGSRQTLYNDTIANTAYPISSFSYPKDLDNDGDIDFLLRNEYDSTGWIKNDSGVFNFNSLTLNTTSTDKILYDFDKDGLYDILSYNNSISGWYRNLGNGNFSSFNNAYYSKDVIDIKDLNNDTLDDILSQSYLGQISWSKSSVGIGVDSAQTISNYFSSFADYEIIDFDNDGDLDVIASSGGLYLFTNLGSGRFNQGVKIANGSYNCITICDIDGDSDLDILGVFQAYPRRIEVIENLGNNNFGSAQTLISVGNQNPPDILILDIDNDGDLDIVSGLFSSELFWLENLGNLSFSPKNTITTNISGSTSWSIKLADLNKDGKLDLISASVVGSTVAWYENIGGNFGPQQIIDNNAVDIWDLDVGDLDGDGDIDIVTASNNNNKISWYENLNLGTFSIEQVINSTMSSPGSISLSDLDRDGDLDICLASNSGNREIAWILNYGSAGFSPLNVLGRTGEGAANLKTKDINNDGDEDIMAYVTFTAGGNKKLVWYENDLLCGYNKSDITICQGDSILIFGSYERVDSSYFDTIQTIIGCDSLIEVRLIVKPSPINNDSIFICQGDSVFLYGNYQSVAGTYYDSLQTINGCDSVLSTTLTIDSSYIFNQNQSICQGDSMLIYGSYQSVAGVYYDSLQTINGCDSVLSITLLVNQVYLSNTNDTICQGDSVLIYGNYENTAGVYYDSLQSILGCDSVLATTLFLNANFNSNQNQEICQGDSILIYGNYENTAGVYYDSLQTINGCDSVLSTTLIVNPLPNVTLTNFNPDTICSTSNAVTLPNGSPSGGVYSGTGVSGGTFDPNTAGLGTHSVIYTYTDVNSCINSDSTFITVEQCVGIDDLANDLGILIYPNPNTGLFTIEKPSELDKEVNISLLDASSRVIIDKLIPKGQQKIEMDITNYSKGVYYLQLTVGKEVFVKQILKN